MIKNITIGSDPEFLIYKDDKPVSSIGIIDGTKADPQEVEPGYGVLKDNVLIEGNIPPAKSKEEFINNFKNLKRIMSEILEIGGYRLVCDDSAKYSEDQLDNDEARTFGCAGFFNAWTMRFGNVQGLLGLPARTCGFHVHMGYTYEGEYEDDWIALYIARAFDYFVTYPSRLEHDDEIRAKYYGDYGNFRITSYGVECRSLGGWFTQDKYLEWVYDQTIKTLEFCSNENNLKLLDKVTSPESNPEENYKILNINLEDQLYGDINIIPVNTAISKAIQ